ATVTGKQKTAAAVVMATAVLAVVAATAPSPSPTPRPTPTPTAAPTRTPAPTATPAPPVVADAQPSFPIRAAFYYPWFPEAWNQQGMNPFANYNPSLGFYDGGNSIVIRQQIA